MIVFVTQRTLQQAKSKRVEINLESFYPNPIVLNPFSSCITNLYIFRIGHSSLTSLWNNLFDSLLLQLFLFFSNGGLCCILDQLSLFEEKLEHNFEIGSLRGITLPAAPNYGSYVFGEFKVFISIPTGTTQIRVTLMTRYCLV